MFDFLKLNNNINYLNNLLFLKYKLTRLIA